MRVMTKTAKQPLWVLQQIVEPHRKRERVSLRTAAERAGLSEATWRQLASGGVMNRGRWVTRQPRRDQVLAMALAAGCGDLATSALEATPDEVEVAKRAVVILDPAEEEIMGARHLRPAEKLRLIEELARLRAEVGIGKAPGPR